MLTKKEFFDQEKEEAKASGLGNAKEEDSKALEPPPQRPRKRKTREAV
jgi:hypothetical protein